MIPLRDTIRSRHFPVMNWLLLIVNALVFFYELSLGTAALNQFINTYALVPARLQSAQPIFIVSLITSLFLHGGWFHFLSNMWILFIFGDNVEDRMGSIAYLFFYLMSGVAASLLQTFVEPFSTLPTIGASGAIAGVLGAYILLYPAARVLTLIPVFIFPWFVEIPAFFYLGFWFLSQLFSGFVSLEGGMSGVAWWAHIGGFLFGLVLSRFFISRPPPPPRATYYQVPNVYRDEW